ncbi:MAG: hypothetical protein LBU60_03420 [Clostridiales bacterium]|jgi:hypothetical protein|nr:hypothetical protein [Clostridiales bacterium]
MKNKLKEIVTPLSNIMCWPTKVMLILGCVVISFLFGIIVVNTIFFLDIEIGKIIGAIIIDIMVVAVTVVYFIFLKLNKERRDRVIDLLHDAVELEAFAEKVDEMYLESRYKNSKYSKKIKLTKIRVKFEFNGQFHEKESKLGWEKKGYHTIFNKYADKHINIFYSPKNDEVMLLKE